MLRVNGAPKNDVEAKPSAQERVALIASEISPPKDFEPFRGPIDRPFRNEPHAEPRVEIKIGDITISVGSNVSPEVREGLDRIKRILEGLQPGGVAQQDNPSITWRFKSSGDDFHFQENPERLPWRLLPNDQWRSITTGDIVPVLPYGDVFTKGMRGGAGTSSLPQKPGHHLI